MRLPRGRGRSLLILLICVAVLLGVDLGYMVRTSGADLKLVATWASRAAAVAVRLLHNPTPLPLRWLKTPDSHSARSTESGRASPSGPLVALTPDRMADTVERVVPSVVGLSGSPGRPDLPGSSTRYGARAPAMPDRFVSHGHGSGVVVMDGCHVLTNQHIIDHVDEIRVLLHQGQQIRTDLIGVDAPTDLALLHLRGCAPGQRPALEFGRSSELRLGQEVLALGNQQGTAATVTMGIVSRTDHRDEGLVVTDAVIDAENSGGPLVDLDGSLVGINITSSASGAQRRGLAVAADVAQLVVERLMADGEVERGWLGIGIQDLSAGLSEVLGVPGQQGVVVSQRRSR